MNASSLHERVLRDTARCMTLLLQVNKHDPKMPDAAHGHLAEVLATLKSLGELAKGDIVDYKAAMQNRDKMIDQLNQDYAALQARYHDLKIEAACFLRAIRVLGEARHSAKG